MKKINIIIITLVSIFAFNINALAMDSSVEVVDNNTTVLETIDSNILLLKNSKKTSNTHSSDGNIDCGILGSPSEVETIGWYLNQILNIMRFLGPVLVILLSVLDLIKVTAEQKQDGALQKFGAKTLKRLIYAALLFVFPSVLNLILQLIGLYGTCEIGLV